MLKEKVYGQRRRNIARAWHEAMRFYRSGKTPDDMDKLAGKMMDMRRKTKNRRKVKKYTKRWSDLSFGYFLWTGDIRPIRGTKNSS